MKASSGGLRWMTNVAHMHKIFNKLWLITVVREKETQVDQWQTSVINE